MSDLSKTIDSVLTTLKHVETELKNNNTDFAVRPYDEWKARWEGMLSSRDCLSDVQNDIVRRDQCFECLKRFRDCQIGGSSSSLIMSQMGYCRTTINTSDVRHHLLVGYLASTWSVYDVLYDFVTRMLGAGIVFDNQSPGANKKLSEVFDPNKKNKAVSQYGAFEKLFEKYWVVHKVSYVFRNAFMHEGGRINGKKVLQGTFAQNYFEISQECQDFFKNNGVDAANPPDSILSNTDVDSRNSLLLKAVPANLNKYPWYSGDIRVILYHYNSKLDDLMSHMLVYAANSLKAHINQCFQTPMSVADARIC